MIKKFLRSGKCPLSQVANRLSDVSNIDVKNKVNDQYPNVKKKNKKFVKVSVNSNFSLTNSFKDKWFSTSEKEIVAFKSAFWKNNKELLIIGTPLNTFSDFFDTPIRSSHLNIFCTKNYSEFKATKLYSVDSVFCKLVAVKNVNNEMVFIPL